MRIFCMRTSSRFLVAAVCGAAFLGASARAEIRVNDPYVRAALEDFERYAAQSKTATAKREKMPVTLKVAASEFLDRETVAAKPMIASE